MLFSYHFLPDYFFSSNISYLCAYKANMTNLNSCWFLWTLQVPQREVGLSRSIEESRLPRAEEWQKCPHVFCLWHCHWWESFNRTARLVHDTFTPVLKMFPLSLTFFGLLGFPCPVPLSSRNGFECLFLRKCELSPWLSHSFPAWLSYGISSFHFSGPHLYKEVNNQRKTSVAGPATHRSPSVEGPYNFLNESVTWYSFLVFSTLLYWVIETS